MFLLLSGFPCLASPLFSLLALSLALFPAQLSFPPFLISPPLAQTISVSAYLLWYVEGGGCGAQGSLE